MEAKELVEKIALLKGKGIIKKDNQVADSTGFSAASLSNMLNGRVPVSAKFERDFLKHYSKFFNENKILESSIELELKHALEKIKLLEAQIELLKENAALMRATLPKL